MKSYIKLNTLKNTLKINDSYFVSRIADTERHPRTSQAFVSMTTKDGSKWTIEKTKEAYNSMKSFLNTGQYDYDTKVLCEAFGVEYVEPTTATKESEIVEVKEAEVESENTEVSEKDLNMANILFVAFSITYAFTFTVPTIYDAVTSLGFYTKASYTSYILSYLLSMLIDLSAYFIFRYGNKRLIIIVLLDMAILALATFGLFSSYSKDVSFLAITLSMVLSFYSLYLGLDKNKK